MLIIRSSIVTNLEKVHFKYKSFLTYDYKTLAMYLPESSIIVQLYDYCVNTFADWLMSVCCAIPYPDAMRRNTYMMHQCSDHPTLDVINSDSRHQMWLRNGVV